ncbi:hypothetical protein CI610_02419 [invertebrate metagenome]|uniref:Uncharacterized protein n=1 Tax=invertebrate metagenome TaxID=1711999 RepID=A0A2H9T5Y5_9ZZZZ
MLMSHNDESYLCLLCLRNSTERIARLYWCYIQMRTQSGDLPVMLPAMLLVLCQKREKLHQTLLTRWPEYMENGKWHGEDTMTRNLSRLSTDSQEDLHRISETELKMLYLVNTMMRQ